MIGWNGDTHPVRLFHRVDLITAKCYAESDPKDVGMALKMYLVMLERTPEDMDATEVRRDDDDTIEFHRRHRCHHRRHHRLTTYTTSM